MDLQQVFQIAGGSVIGKDHISIGKNNQDAIFYPEQYDRVLSLIVCDGCGGQPHSEVGAKLFAPLIGTAIERQLGRYPDHSFLRETGRADAFLKRIKDDALAYMRMIAINLGDSMSRAVNDLFLFTVVGAIITEEVSIFFSLGDGVIFVNGKRIQIGPWPNNEPPYLGYNLVKSTLNDENPQLLNFHIHEIAATQELEHALISSDGLVYLEAAAKKTIPGRPMTSVGYLNIVNETRQKIDWMGQKIEKEFGHLSDDATLAVIRRRPAQ